MPTQTTLAKKVCYFYKICILCFQTCHTHHECSFNKPSYKQL